MRNKFNYFPYNPLFIIILLFVILFLFVVLQIGIITYAYEKLGIDEKYVFLILLLSILGSYINIPLTESESGEITTQGYITIFGMRYTIPVYRKEKHTVIAVNLGGAIIPILLSIYLAVSNGIFVQSVVGISVISLIVHLIARPVYGIGIAVPVVIPPVAAALLSFIIPVHSPAALAYISGTMGTLIGADILNLNRIKQLGAPVASIGGAGTFDGIFMTGILAVLLA